MDSWAQLKTDDKVVYPTVKVLSLMAWTATLILLVPFELLAHLIGIKGLLAIVCVAWFPAACRWRFGSPSPVLKNGKLSWRRIGSSYLAAFPVFMVSQLICYTLLIPVKRTIAMTSTSLKLFTSVTVAVSVLAGALTSLGWLLTVLAAETETPPNLDYLDEALKKAVVAAATADEMVEEAAAAIRITSGEVRWASSDARESAISTLAAARYCAASARDADRFARRLRKSEPELIQAIFSAAHAAVTAADAACRVLATDQTAARVFGYPNVSSNTAVVQAICAARGPTEAAYKAASLALACIEVFKPQSISEYKKEMLERAVREVSQNRGRGTTVASSSLPRA